LHPLKGGILLIARRFNLPLLGYLVKVGRLHSNTVPAALNQRCGAVYLIKGFNREQSRISIGRVIIEFTCRREISVHGNEVLLRKDGVVKLRIVCWELGDYSPRRAPDAFKSGGALVSLSLLMKKNDHVARHGAWLEAPAHKHAFAAQRVSDTWQQEQCLFASRC
jgi:hypothetical protein